MAKIVVSLSGDADFFAAVDKALSERNSRAVHRLSRSAFIRELVYRQLGAIPGTSETRCTSPQK